MDASRTAMQLAREVGFDLVGIAPLAPPRDLGRFDDWLAAGRHADLGWLERDRERIAAPGQLLPRGRSMLVVGLGHSRPAVTLADGVRVARYAAGRDYHNVVGKMLRRLRSRLVDAGLFAREAPFRKVVDAGPLLERSHAAEAGLGFASKAANLLHPRFGPWFFLGELLIECELEPTVSPPAGSCGTCRLCLDACPTDAILAPGVVDAGLCVSYQTIENRGSIPRQLRPGVGAWGFGCDICSEVCPWGQEAPDLSERFGTHAALRGAARDWLGIRNESEFEALTLGSPLARPGRAGLARNAAIALGNRPSEAGREALVQAIDGDPSPLVRSAAAWGLARGHGQDEGVLAVLERAAARESDPAVADELRIDLEAGAAGGERSNT